MKKIALFFQFGALCSALAYLVVGTPQLRAQAAAENAPAKAPAVDDAAQTELLRSYLQVREQLHAAQLAIINNRVESEAAARAQAAAVTEKLEGIKSAMQIERERALAEARRITAERERQQAETERANRNALWIAAAFGGVGLIAMFVTLLFQWRAIHRMTEATTLRPQLGEAPRQALLGGDGVAPSGEAVTLSNQRMMSVIDRMERRIFELEHTAEPVITPSANGKAESEPARRVAADTDQEAWIAVLLSKGRSLLTANKPRDAVACYDEILKLSSTHPEALVRKGTALERLNRYEEALQCYDRAIEADRNMTLAYVHKGGVCNRLERYDEALECYEQALQAQEK